MRISTRPFLPVVLVMVSVAAAAGTAPKAPPAQTTHHTSHWSYAGDAGPSHWGALDPAYAACATGKHQSPIDLVHAVAIDATGPALYYQPSELRVLNNGHTVQVNYDKGSSMDVDGRRYELVQLHYHAPSEHRVNGKAFAAELHLVHKSAEGQLAVIGVLLDEGDPNPAYESFLKNLPKHETQEAAKHVTINAADLVPATLITFHYDGSLTTPPCTEGVSWFVMETPVHLSHAQIAALEDVFKGNNRPVQPTNGRTLTEEHAP